MHIYMRMELYMRQCIITWHHQRCRHHLLIRTHRWNVCLILVRSWLAVVSNRGFFERNARCKGPFTQCTNFSPRGGALHLPKTKVFSMWTLLYFFFVAQRVEMDLIIDNKTLWAFCTFRALGTANWQHLVNIKDVKLLILFTCICTFNLKMKVRQKQRGRLPCFWDSAPLPLTTCCSNTNLCSCAHHYLCRANTPQKLALKSPTRQLSKLCCQLNDLVSKFKGISLSLYFRLSSFLNQTY